MYGWKCLGARATVFELSVPVAHSGDDHFERSGWRIIFLLLLPVEFPKKKEVVEIHSRNDDDDDRCVQAVTSVCVRQHR